MKKLLLAIFAVLFSTIGVFAQETSSTLNGNINDEKGLAIAGATITAIHIPTGISSTTQTNKKGLFSIPNLKAGGPYTVKVTFVGYQEEKMENLNLILGNNPDINIGLKINTKSMSEVVVSTGKRLVGAGMNIGRAQLNSLPTLGRSLSDFTRLTPQSNNNSYAGSNFRYNNLTIDGAINNDAIGFSNSFGGVSGGGQSGAAGSGTRTNPYSIDAIQEVQVQLAPFDVKLGNFTGGSVNAVTKSGTNNFHGSAYVYLRNQALMGKSVDGLKTKIGSDFHEYQYGASFSGPLVKNKAFFFVNFEQTRRQEPTFYNIGDPGAAVNLTDAQAIYNKLQALGYDAGSYTGAFKLFTNSDKLFTRFDFKLSNKSTLMLRAIYTSGSGNNLERSSTNFQFGSTDFTQYTKNLNLVAELKTKISNNLNNQFNMSYIDVHEYRTFPGALAPFVDIDNGRIWAGTWREASIYNMKQKTIEISDNVTYTKGINKFTFGTHNEFYDLTYGFINSWNGRWEYSRGVNSFLNNNPSRVRGAFSRNTGKLPNDREAIYNNPPNPFKVSLLSFYTQDEIAVNKRLKITPGFRIDYSSVNKQPGVDSNLNATVRTTQTSNPTYSNTPFSEMNNTYLGKASFSPRLGFNYDVNGNGSVVIRGGTGIFLGRMPFAWMGYGYTLNGNTYGNIDWNNISSSTTVPLAINPYGLKDTVTKYGGASRSSTRELDIVDNNFKLPRVWRTNLAVDYKFGKGYKATFDVLYTKTLYDVKFQQVNLFDSVQYFTTGPTQSPIYVARGSGTNGKYNSNYSNVYFLSNTKEGYRYNITGSISKTSSDIKVGSHLLDVNWSLAYTYGVSKDISNGIRNSWESNFNLNPAIAPNDPQLGYSNFDLRNRIVGTFGGNFHWNTMNTTSLTFYYAGQSGNPYTLVYQSAPGSGGSNAALPYVPKDQSDIRLADYTLNGTLYTAAQQWTDLNSFIDGDSYLKTRRGQYAERNGMRTPWNNELDMKLMHEFKLSRTNKQHTLQVSLDIFNVLNLISNSWGHVNFVTNVNQYDVNFLKYATDANGKAAGTPASGYLPTFNFVKPTGVGGHYYTLDPINSRWQGQFGVKYNF
ncbi:MAG: carboxypeptidase regulatory-like domain-containing protein [Sphingobacteriales bacterium]|nr:carboxypeptidase regulatory-like domain-containing protein [Sphingobacteriales bacterium]